MYQSHPLSGMIVGVKAHVRVASVHQKARAMQSLSDIRGTYKKRVSDICGPYIRAHESFCRLSDVAADVAVAKQFLQGSEADGQTAIGYFSELALEARKASPEARISATVALDSVHVAVNDAVTELEPVMKKSLADARETLVKYVCANVLHTKSMLDNNRAGLVLAEGTVIHAELPRELLTGAGGLTDSGEEKLAASVTKSYLRQLEDERLIREEYANADAREAQKMLHARATAALSMMGVLK
jgi:hypothetical protein